MEKTVAVVTHEWIEHTGGFWWIPDTTPGASLALFEAEKTCWAGSPVRVRLLFVTVEASLSDDELTEVLDDDRFDEIFEKGHAVLDEMCNA